jgi:hypothetical protein
VGIGASIVMIAIGAILKYALPSSVLGINLGVIGVILMVIGVVGLAVTLLIWGPWHRPLAEPSDVVAHRRRPLADGDEVVEERRIYGQRPPY